ncbi:CRISPR-associated protein, TM1812 family [Ectothiorhodospira magna]|uniref:CRISPR-associated protein, TM1812 family n=1 Tax=Ectothiorhodospira magna TaxID=867345 RepID=A0A1H9GC26_9GAMM|nr:TIGR02221 family CRISPR-associated protein [Ectothiorhodospira magna]SEQ47636.1 CRISPR-associated protein, TM1812 family [Ectothiorhodospira magna]
MKNHTLITFLGRGRLTDNNGNTTGYRKAHYLFPDGTRHTTPYFGLALANYTQPDRLLILGTAGSMWSALLEDHISDGANEDLRMSLLEAEGNEAVTANQVAQLPPLLSLATGREISTRLIPAARDIEEQLEILQTMAEQVKAPGRITLDVTHGFRHFGMLGFLSGFMLQRIKKLEVEGIWYGALDMAYSDADSGDPITPVLSLDGLHAVQEWISALERFDASGDYSVFADLLRRDGLPDDKAECLRQAAFHEITLNTHDAAQKLLSVLPMLDKPLQGASELFRERLRQRLEWAKYQRASEQQHHLAQRALERGDYQRCAILAFEARITWACEQSAKNPLNRRDREAVHDREISLARQGRHDSDHPDTSLDDLAQIRNAVAHGTPPSYVPLQKVIKNPRQLREFLKKSLASLPR